MKIETFMVQGNSAEEVADAQPKDRVGLRVRRIDEELYEVTITREEPGDKVPYVAKGWKTKKAGWSVYA